MKFPLRINSARWKMLTGVTLGLIIGAAACDSTTRTAENHEAVHAADAHQEKENAQEIRWEKGYTKNMPHESAKAETTNNQNAPEKIVKTEQEWQKALTPEQFEVMRKKGTERAFTGALWNEHGDGEYLCAACGLELFGSDTKFESGTGWPSFWKPLTAKNVETTTDYDLGLPRTEVHCRRCGAHLGHVFDDGPAPTGLRYCMNSVSLKFKPKASATSAESQTGEDAKSTGAK